MNTATIFVENLIQGFQTAVWIALVTATCTDFTSDNLKFVQANVPSVVTSVLFGSIFLAACYWLGLVVDTAYYNSIIQRFESRWSTRFRAADEPTLLAMALACTVHNADVAALLKERQTHLRMFRVSVVNSALITLAASLFILVRVAVHKWLALSLCIFVGGLSFYVSCYVWFKLYKLYVTIIRTGYHLIPVNLQQPPTSADALLHGQI